MYSLIEFEPFTSSLNSKILDDGFSTKHKYYYCGDQVTAEPDYVDDSLARFLQR